MQQQLKQSKSEILSKCRAETYHNHNERTVLHLLLLGLSLSQARAFHSR